jgi:hypothetical protein
MLLKNIALNSKLEIVSSKNLYKINKFLGRRTFQFNDLFSKLQKNSKKLNLFEVDAKDLDCKSFIISVLAIFNYEISHSLR